VARQLVEWWMYLTKFGTLPALGADTMESHTAYDRCKEISSDFRQRGIHLALSMREYVEKEWYKIQEKCTQVVVI
jgi:hypothetical protein